VSRSRAPVGAAVASFGDWALYARPASGDPSWRRYKLVKMPRAKSHCAGRRSYSLAWCAAEARLARNSEAAALFEHEPRLYGQVVDELRLSRLL
jgi:hypothetical protein